MASAKNVIAIYHELLANEQLFNLPFILIAFIVVILWLGTASLAAEYAEVRGGRSGMILAGNVLFPILGPAITFLIFAAKVKQAASHANAEVETEEMAFDPAGQKPDGKKESHEKKSHTKKTHFKKHSVAEESDKSSETGSVPVEENAVETVDPSIEVDKDYFDRIMNELGEEQSYVIKAGERVYNVKQIVECLPNVLVMIVEDEYGKQHRMRVPYEKITNVRY